MLRQLTENNTNSRLALATVSMVAIAVSLPIMPLCYGIPSSALMGAGISGLSQAIYGPKEDNIKNILATGAFAGIANSLAGAAVLATAHGSFPPGPVPIDGALAGTVAIMARTLTGP